MKRREKRGGEKGKRREEKRKKEGKKRKKEGREEEKEGREEEKEGREEEKRLSRMKTNKKYITTSIFGVGRCEAAHKYENGDFCQK
ncbi:MAG: hypothetical protein FWE54_03195 [Methanimicrococcus sp.]|nr:hypothetical protein [Methanimicrococcus sp.]